MLNIKDVEKFHTFTVDRDILQVPHYTIFSTSFLLKINSGSKSRTWSEGNWKNWSSDGDTQEQSSKTKVWFIINMTKVALDSISQVTDGNNNISRVSTVDTNIQMYCLWSHEGYHQTRILSPIQCLGRFRYLPARYVGYFQRGAFVPIFYILQNTGSSHIP